MRFSLATRALAFALFSLPLLASAQNQAGVEVVVRGQLPVERLAQMLNGRGSVVARERVAHAYRIRLAPGLGVDYARRLFGPRQPFQFVRDAGYAQIQGGLDPDSTSSIERFISKFEVIKDEKPDHDKGDEDEGKDEAPDALQAKLYRLRQFAFPYDKIDPMTQIRAAAQLEQLRRGGDHMTNGGPPPTEKWVFTGPKGLDIPYEIYYGTPPLSGRVNAVAYDPNTTSTIYCGGALGGVWKSTDSGTTWKSISDDGSWPFLSVNSITVNPSNTAEILVGVGDNPGGLNYGAGIMKTTNGGQSWTRLSEANGLPAASGITKIAFVSPGDGETGDVLIATAAGGAQGACSVYRSTDDGGTWTQVISSASAQGSGFTGLAVSAKGGDNKRWVYAVDPGQNAGKRLWVSKDRGATWTTAATDPVTKFGYVPQLDIAAAHDAATGTAAQKDARRQRIYLLAARPAPDYDPGTSQTASAAPYDTLLSNGSVKYNGRVFTSTDSGSTWTDRTDAAFWDREPYNWSQYFYNYHITSGAVRNPGTGTETDDFFFGQVDLVGSRDGGVTFSSLGGPSYAGDSILHNDQHAMAVNPNDPDDYLVGNDGGVFHIHSTNGQPAVTSLNRTMGVSQFYNAAWHPTDLTRMLGGTQDNASPAALGDLANWKNVGAGDGGFSAINPAMPGSQFTTYQYLGAFFTSGGLTFTLLATDDGWTNRGETPQCTTTNIDNLTFISPIHTSKGNPDWLFVGTRYLSRYNVSEHTWTPALGGQPWSNDGGEVALHIGTAAGAPGTVLVGTSDGVLRRTLDGGNTWSNATGNLPLAIYTDMSFDPNDPKKVVVTLSRQDATPHVWASDDITAATPVWRDVSYKVNGQEIEMGALSIDRDFDSPSDSWYVGTQYGVLYTNNGGATYSDLGLPNGLPRTEVPTLVTNSTLRTVDVATYGRGMYRLTKGAPGTAGVLTGFAFDPRQIRPMHYSKGTVTLKAKAGAGGETVALTTYSEGSLYFVRGSGGKSRIDSIVIPAGKLSSDFYAYATPSYDRVETVKVEAKLNTVTRSNTIAIAPPKASGTVTFGDVASGGATPTRLQYWIRRSDGSVFKRGYANLDANHAYRIIGVPEGSYTLTLRGGTFLGKKLPFNSVSSDPVLNYTLINGDVNGDNVVDGTDAQAVTAALGSRPGSANWNANADLNKDNIVNSTDAAIVRNNRGKGDD